MAFKIPKNTLICIGILIAVLVGLYFAGFLNKEKLPKFLQEDYERTRSLVGRPMRRLDWRIVSRPPNAWPRWLSACFCAAGTSANVQPNSGT